MGICGDFLEVFILKGLRGQKNRQNTANTWFLDRFILKHLTEQRTGRPKK